MESHPAYDRIHEAIASVEAPHSLRMRIEDERERTLVRRLVVRRMKLAGVGAGVAAVLGAVVALVAPSGGGGAGVPDVVALAGKASLATPAVSADPHVLRTRVASIAFPTWSAQGLRPTGQRVDDLEGGRRVVTVFYAAREAAVAYSISDGGAMDWPDGSRVAARANGIEIRALRQGERNVVVWRERGLTCVLSAPRTVPRARLVKLAAGVARYYA